MERTHSAEKEVFVDLESGMNGVVADERRTRGVVESHKEWNGFISDKEASRSNERGGIREDGEWHKAWSGFISDNGLMRSQEVIPRPDPAHPSPQSNNGDDMGERRLSSGEETVNVMEKVVGYEMPRRKGDKKPPKPPRPPKSSSLGAMDQKILREMSELAVLKRERMKRMKALKKMKNSKPATSSSGSSICALVVTIVFCSVVLWQVLSGAFTKNASTVRYQGSPESSVALKEGLISIRFYKDTSRNGAPFTSVAPKVV